MVMFMAIAIIFVRPARTRQEKTAIGKWLIAVSFWINHDSENVFCNCACYYRMCENPLTNILLE